MSSVVLDASAILVVVCDEDGSQVVAEQSNGALVSTVNLAEVFSETADIKVSVEELQWALTQLQLVAVPLTYEHAAIAGSLRESTRKFGLSLGDRACLAVAIEKGLPVLTADRSWNQLDIGVKVKSFRPSMKKTK